MAEITAVTRVGRRLPVGDLSQQTYRVVVANAAAADEFITTDFTEIKAVVGYAALGATVSSCNFVLNGNSTADTEGDVPGALGIEASAAADILVTVLGKV